MLSSRIVQPFSRHHLQLPGFFSRRLFSSKTFEPLRILFCGSDEFSITSLRALHAEGAQRPGSIASIDVVCRPGKRVGRGLKTIREVPIKEVATQLTLPIHEIDTFTGWTPPIGPIDLIIAVSFGLFVPPRILKAAKYGGLNVHPSLLPDFRGPAPLHHTLLAGRTRTGVTLQTLHPERFDHGIILDQTPCPGFEIPNPEFCTVAELLEIVAPRGAEMLVNGIRNRIFLPPFKNAGWLAAAGGRRLTHAAKITPEDRHLDWSTWTWPEISRRNRVLGSLWSKALAAEKSSEGSLSLKSKRVIFTRIEEVEPLLGSEHSALMPGVPFVDNILPLQTEKRSGLYVFTRDDKLIRICEMKVEGQKAGDAVIGAIKAKMLSDRIVRLGPSKFSVFYNPFH